jgi:hypothetical protein
VKAIAITELTHNPFDKTRWVSGLRENFTSRSYGEGLETDRTAPRQSLTRQTWHKVLKSGCKVEDFLLETSERLTRYLTVFSIIGVRLMHVCYLARVQPDIAGTEVFSKEEIEALHVRVNSALPPPEPPSLREVVRMIGSLAGHLGRKCDGEPGVTALWRGWMRLYEDVIVLGAHKKALGLINSS